jgi:hypothetical protein
MCLLTVLAYPTQTPSDDHTAERDPAVDARSTLRPTTSLLDRVEIP